jgi:hypothetical protein
MLNNTQNHKSTLNRTTDLGDFVAMLFFERVIPYTRLESEQCLQAELFPQLAFTLLLARLAPGNTNNVPLGIR